MTKDARERALTLIQEYGWNSTSFQSLEPFFEYWFDPSGVGVVAYYRAWGTWVVAGAPICPLDHITECAMSFVAAAKEAGYRVCFFGTAARFTQQFRSQASHVKIGEQPCWNPERWSGDSKRMKLIGSQRRRAERKGVHVVQVSPQLMAAPDSRERQQAEQVITKWQRAQTMATMSYLVHLDAFSFASERRYFLAEQTTASGETQAVGFLSLVPIYARDGFFLEDLIRIPSAPNGTTEALIDAAMQAISREGKAYATLGLSPLRNIHHSRYVQPYWARLIFGVSRRLFDPVYRFRGLEAFKAKLRPEEWEEIYVTGIPRFNLNMLVAVLMAFVRSHPTRFALDTLFRLVGSNLQAVRDVTWQRWCYGLAITLVAWIIILSQCDGVYWFGSTGMLQFWIAFDIAMVGVLVSVGYGIGKHAKFVRWLSVLTLMFVVGDLSVTAWQAVRFFTTHPFDAFTVSGWLVAMGGPAFASIFLASMIVAFRIGVVRRISSM